MKTTPKAILAVLALLLFSFQSAHAVNVVQLSIQGNDVHLRWPSQPGQTFIIGYRPTLDPSTPWTFLETAYAASQGIETTFVHHGVVVFPAAPAGGGGDSPPSPASSESSTSWSTMSEEQRAARREELYKQAQAAADYLMALLKEAVAKAEADRERWEKEGYPTRTTTADGPQPDGPDPIPLGSMGFYFVVEYGEDVDGDGLPSGCEIFIGHNILKLDSDGDGIGDGAEDTDADGNDDFTECMLGSDPLVPDSGPLPPLSDGLVRAGQYDIQFTPIPGYQNILGPLLFCNNGVTADGLVTTEPEPGHLRLNWNSTFIQYGGFFAGPIQADGPQPDGPEPQLTDAERAALRDAFGEGTDMDVGRLSSPNQAKVDQLPEHVLDYYQNVASEQLRKEFQLIQEVNTGVRQPPPGMTLERYMKIRLNQVHTQFTRLQAVNSSLWRRFGRAVNRILPFLGGIIILANADSIAADFLSAMQDYARDILNGDDETGSAAILAGRCNDLAPGSGNIVLNYLLR